MGALKVVNLKIKGGEASEKQLGPTISQLGLDVKEVIDEINRKTKKFEGMEVKVKLIVDEETKEYEIEIKPPTTTELLLKAVGASKPSGDPMHQKIGDLPFEKIVEIA